MLGVLALLLQVQAGTYLSDKCVQCMNENSLYMYRQTLIKWPPIQWPPLLGSNQIPNHE